MSFWQVIDGQLAELRKAKSAADVIRILGGKENASSGDAFFAGGGGDDGVWDALTDAGWGVIWSEADYYFRIQAPNGDIIEYVEGDIYDRTEVKA